MRNRLAATGLVLLVAAGCGGEGTKATGKSCDGLLKPADAAAALPADVPAGIDGVTFYELETQGATKRHLGYVAGTGFVATRDAIKAAYEAAGLTIESVDEESVEAEFSWSGTAKEGSVQVIPLCQGQLHLRYRFGPK